MKMDCAALSERLVRLAEGLPEPTAMKHLQTCPQCAARLQQLKAILSLAGVERYDAPDELIEMAKAMMPRSRRALVATLLRSSYAAGARSVPEAAQLLVGSEGMEVRMLLQKRGSHYEILGELPSQGWRVSSEAGDVSQRGSRFQLLVGVGESTAYVAESDEVLLIVPSVEELLSRGTGSAG